MITDEDKKEFLAAISKNDVQKIESLVAACPELLKTRFLSNKESYTPLQMAMLPHLLDTLRTLLRLGVPVTPVDLTDCCCDNSQEYFDIVMEYKPDVNAKTDKGHFALEQAAITRNPYLTEKLLERGALIDMRNGWGATALHKAVEQCNFDVIPVLLKANADITIEDDNGLTALNMAEESSLFDIIRMFDTDIARRKEAERQRIKKIAADSIVTTEEITPPDIKINPVRRQLRL